MAGLADKAILGTIPLFRDLSSADLSRLISQLHSRSYDAGVSVMTAEQPGEIAFIILDGTLKVHREQLGGSDVIFAILRAGEIVGEMSLVDAFGRSATVTAIDRSTLLGIDRDAFWLLLRGIPALTHNLVRILSRRLRLANAQIEALASLDVPARVAWQIKSLSEEYGELTPSGVVIPFHLSQGEIASLVGATRVRVNQVMALLRRAGCIRTGTDGRIVVLDEAGLAQHCR